MVEKTETISETITAGIEIHNGDLDLVLWARTAEELEKVVGLYKKYFNVKT